MQDKLTSILCNLNIKFEEKDMHFQISCGDTKTEIKLDSRAQ